MDLTGDSDLEPLADDRGFSISEETHKAYREIVTDFDLPASAASGPPISPEPRGDQSDDEYNAWLAC